MTTYIALFNLTDAGIKAAKDSPRRLDAAKRLLADMGGEMTLAETSVASAPFPAAGGETAMVRSRALVSAIFCNARRRARRLCGASLPPGYYISGDPPGTREVYCGQWSVVPTSCVSPRAVY